ncbi:thioredoxin [Falsiporphyromonas endometrii]|uniref:Thioredoxin n=1 Tax=Falsiporphyromonas endometrii TaxID=1387297 RepID=A0ABV9K7D1_9PORP
MSIKYIKDKTEFSKLVSEVRKGDPMQNWYHEGRKPVIVDFFATWCGPCSALSPILEVLAEDYQDKVDIYKVDVDQCPDLTEMFNIRTVPTLLFSKRGVKMPTLMLGVLTKPQLKEIIDKWLEE